MRVIEQKTEALRQNEIKFRTLFEYANEAIFILHNGVIVDCNYCTELLFDLSYQDIIGCSPEALSPVYQPNGQTSKPKARDIRKKLSLGKPCVFEWRYLREKREFDAEVSLGLYLGENEFY
ncbi:PAS domain-containing protein [Sporomusa acidovorans]|uniref:PAS domain-containing protein n=1 Tax=Sporomusa acidovorans (strain ATCC 49682 / DSM 3132 / Mol) TaxID=1123286 RepID=A0ABZ3J386_SPOA4|nr:PAS domain-containing protein [Sporomusa acidovorans]OZC24333.1 hypothetical protein SPACI_00200 [Sporomusa acidovorans DSM 3132]SDF76641.1 PAS domain-containing protein [Sporomusa acidovorans]